MSVQEQHQEYAAQVGAWAAALRTGRSETWAEFRAGQTAVAASDPGSLDGPLPGGAQLEVVRRLAVRHPGLPRFAELADLVLSAASPGRGLVDTPLPWPGEDRRFGSPAIEPELLPSEELVRVACAVLVELLVAAPVPAPAPVDRGRFWRRHGFVLRGAPGSAAAVRDALVAAGWREGGLRPTYVVLGLPLEDLMAQRWAARIRAGAGMRWVRMWRTAEKNDRVPKEIRTPDIAARLARRYGAGRVHVVLAPDPEALVRAVGTALGIDLGPAGPAPYADVTGTDLLRRINPLLDLAVGEQRRRELLVTNWPAVRGKVTVTDRYAAGIAGPHRLHAWGVAAGTRMADALRAGARSGDYAVHGDPDVLVPVRDRVRPHAVAPADVLELALALVAELWPRADEGTG